MDLDSPPELTDEAIDEALERARRAVCLPTDRRCHALSVGTGEGRLRKEPRER